jgi:hypothetical protein
MPGIISVMTSLGPAPTAGVKTGLPAGLSDDKERLCFAPALWNGEDAILKEHLFRPDE